MAELTVIVPIRGLLDSKSRLAPVLGRQDRVRLVATMGSRVVKALHDAVPEARILIVTRDSDVAWLENTRSGLVEHIHQADSNPGLNEALALGRKAAEMPTPPRRLMVLSGDLPLLTADDILDFLASDQEITIAGDKSGDGTNGLLLSSQQAILSFPFLFGIRSQHRHVESARQLGFSETTLTIHGLTYDLDTPEDWHSLSETARSELLEETKVPQTNDDPMSILEVSCL